MPQLFQQNETTAQYRRFYISIADPDNPLLGKEGLTVTGADFRITKAGGAFGDFAGTITGVSDGLYLCEAAAADLDTLGALVGKIEMTGAVTRTYDCGQVLPWDPYDGARLGMTDPIPDNGITAAKIAGDAIDASELAADVATEIAAAVPSAAAIADAVWDEDRASHTTAGSFGRAAQVHKDGTAQAGSASTIRLDALANANNNFYKGSIVKLVEGTGVGQSRLIKSYTGATKDADVYPDWVTAPDVTTKFVIEPFAGFGIAGAVLDELLASHATAGSLGKAVSDIQTALAALAIQVARLLGLAHENAMLDGGDGFPNVQHTANKLTFARLRVFADDAALDAATPGAADDADNEIYRYEITVTYSGNDVATYQIKRVL